MDAAFDNASRRVAARHAGSQIFVSLFVSFIIRHTSSGLKDCFFIKSIRCNANRADGAGVGKNLYPQFLQNLSRDGAGSDAADGLPPGRTSAAPIVTEPVLCIKGIVRMAGAVIGSDFAVIPRLLGGIFYDKGNRGASGKALKDAGKYFHKVIFLTGGGNPGLPRLTPI